MAERMLLHPDVGSIASIASSGFEWLQSNEPVHRAVISAWFDRPDLADAVTGYEGVYLGEIMLGAKNELAEAGSSTFEGMVESYVTLGDPALRIDIAPPRLYVWQDQGDRPWELPEPPPFLENGTSLRATNPETREALFAVRVFDEVPIDSTTIRIGRRVNGDTSWLPTTAYEVTSGPVDTTTVWHREWYVRYNAPIEASDHDLVFEATDFNARVMSFALPARVDVAFFDVGPTGDERPLQQGAFLDPARTLRVKLDTPIALTPDEVNVTLNGRMVSSVVKTPVGSPAAGSSSFAWRLDADLSSLELNDGTNQIGTEWATGSGAVASRDVSVSASQTFKLDRYFVYPNPFNKATDVFYRVTQPVREAKLEIYTLSGRLIRTIEQDLPTVDLNRIHWDGRDEDGDGVANGVYLYHFEFVSPDGSRSTKEGKIARVAGPAQ
jgi:hypothetical protein